MGCCFSRTSGSESPYSSSSSSSAGALNAPAPPTPTSVAPTATATAATTAPSTTAAASSRSRSRRSAATTTSTARLDAHVNAPLRRHTWTSSTTKALPRRHGQRTRHWTPEALARERDDFFDTRVTGRAEVWRALGYVAAILRDPEGEDVAGDGSRGLATAQSILDAAGVTLPDGDFGDGGAYDEAGNFYAVPGWVVANPPSKLLVVGGDEDEDDEDDADEASMVQHARTGKGDDSLDSEEEDEDEVTRRREEKGKAVLDPRNTTKVTVRLSETARDLSMRIGKTETVRSVARRIAEEAGLAPAKRVRIAYMGRLLKENTPLLDQGFQPGHIMNGLVFVNPQ